MPIIRPPLCNSINRPEAFWSCCFCRELWLTSTLQSAIGLLLKLLKHGYHTFQPSGCVEVFHKNEFTKHKILQRMDHVWSYIWYLKQKKWKSFMCSYRKVQLKNCKAINQEESNQVTKQMGCKAFVAYFQSHPSGAQSIIC